MLFRKMLRDILNNKMQFISIFLMSFLGLFVFAGISGEHTGVEQVRDQYYKDTNLADGWLYGSDFTQEDEDALLELGEITKVQRRLVADAVGDDDEQPEIKIHFQDKNVLCQPRIQKGKDFDTNDSKSVWLDERFAKTRKLSVGDGYTFVIEGQKLTLKIAGLIMAPEYVYYQRGNDLAPDFSKIGYAYCSMKVLSEAGYKVPYSQLLFTTTKKDILALDEKIDKALDGGYAAFVDRHSITGPAMLDGEMKQHTTMSYIFPVAFMAIAVLAIITTMNRMVSNQRTQIGTLKALGVRKGKITSHYLYYSFFLSLAGSVLGAIVGPLTLPKLFFGPLSKFYTIPEWREGFSPLFFILAVVTVALCTLTTYFSCRKILNVNPAETLRPSAPRKANRSFLERTKIWTKIGFSTQYNLRDLSRAKIRSLMGFIGTMSCMALLVCSMSMYDSIYKMENWMYDEIEGYETKMIFDEEITKEEAKKLKLDTDGELIMSSQIEIKKDGKKETMGLTVVDENGIYQVTNAKAESRPLKDSDFALTKKAAERLGIKEGDKIEWHLYSSEKWMTGTVTIINRMPTFAGILMSKAQFDKTGYDFTPSYLGTQKKLTECDNSHVIGLFQKKELYESIEKMMESMIIMIACLIVMAVILAIVVLYNIGLLSFAERERELATLKVVGFRTGRLRNLLMKQNSWLAVLGVIAGTPVGLWLVKVMIEAAGESFDMRVTISTGNFCICAAITLGLSVFVSLLFSGKIKKLDMVSSLKGVE